MRVRTILILQMLLALPLAAGATIQLPSTGQSSCWDTAGVVIDCAGTGQDAETKKGVAWPVPRFRDNGDGTLVDLMTGLVWLRNANCFGHVSWQQALDNANTLASGACGLIDGSVAGAWRLPNRTELLSIASQNFSNGGVWLTSQGFVNALHDYYWTSDTCLDYGGIYKWVVHPVGAAYPDSWNLPSGSRVVMLVRDPQQVTVTAAVVGGHGVVASANPLVMASGTAAAFALSPELGYQLDHVVTGTCQRGSFSGDVYDLGVATADCNVSFSFSPITHDISTSTSGSGSLVCTPTGAVPYGVDVTCTAAPATDNHIAAVTIDGTDVSVTEPASYSYTFAAVTTDHSVHVAFAIDSYSILFRSGGNGTLTGSTSQTVERGASTTPVTAVPATHYHFINWTGDNSFVPTSANPLTLDNVTTGRTITANFAPDSYLVTPGSSANGSIVPALPQTVSYNGVTSFTLNPDTGYGVASASGCGGTLVGGTYTTAPVTGDCSVQFSFTPLTYTITTSTSGLGSLQCTPAGSVAYNGAVSCAAVPQAGNHIAAVTVDGVSQAVSDPLALTHAFSAVTANHTMRADFAVNSYTVTFVPGSNGTLAGSTTQTVNHGGSCTAVSAVPATGYHFVNWTGDNGFVPTSATPLTVNNVTTGWTITANFALDNYLVTPGSAANGNIAPALPQMVNYNDVTSFTLNPDTGYGVASASGCGGTLVGGTYTTAPVTGDCNVQFSFTPLTYTITTSTSGLGSIQCTPAESVAYNGTVSCTAVPQAGNHIAAATVDGVSQAVSDPLALTHAFSAVTANHTMRVDFAVNSYAVTFAPASNGTLVGSTTQTVNHGGNCTVVSAVPATGYHFVNWTGDGDFTATSSNPLTIVNVTRSQGVSANFAVDTHVVSVSGTVNGSISPAAQQTVNYNGVTSFSVTPATGYRVASVTGCGGALSGATYTTAPVTADCNVAATFALLSYDIVGTASNDNGSITCNSPVNYGGSASCTLSARPGYQLAAITDNGADCLPLVADNGYSMSSVTAGHTVAAAFAPRSYVIADVLAAYHSMLGQPLSEADKVRYDVAPLGGDGRPAPDGTVDVADVVLLLRKLVGVLNW